MSNELSNLISEIALEVNPEIELDNNQDVGVTDESTEVEEEVDDLTDTLSDEEEVEDTEDTEIEEDEEDDIDDDAKFIVKVDGEKFEVTLDELKSGYQRQADYTREKQALKAEIEAFTEEKSLVSEQLSAIEELDKAWSNDPSQVITQFAASTDNPTQTVALLIKELATANLLDSDFIRIFGITPEVQAEWRKESEIVQLRNSTQKVSSDKEAELQEAQMEIEVQKAINAYDKQIDEILESEGLDYTSKQRTAFRQSLTRYAADNELTNLKAAYKAFKYEESQNNKKLAAKTVEKAKAKKATNVVSRSSSGEGNSVADTSDLTSVIKQAMKDAGN